jgi:type I restriction enzyme, S subunit
MNEVLSLISLKDIVKPVERPETPIPGKLYKQIGVKLWGEGAYQRESIDGSQTKYKKLSRTETNDIIVNKIWARNGSVTVIPSHLAGCYVSSEFPSFRPNLDKLEPRWFYWFTKTKFCWEQCDEKSRGTSGKNRIRPEKFLEIKIPLPALEEQRRIVAKVEELAVKIEEARSLREQTIKETKALIASEKNAIFSERFSSKYSSMQLGEISEIRAGVTLGRKLQGNTISLPYLRVANVQDGYLDLKFIKTVEIYEPEQEKWQLKPGDILLTEGGDWDKLGRGTVWQGEIADCIHQNHIYRVRVNPNEFNSEYLSALIGSPYGKSYFQQASKQTTNLATINQKQLKAFVVFKPPLAQQQQIVAYLDRFQSKVDEMKRLREKALQELDALLPSILDRAFKGEL